MEAANCWCCNTGEVPREFGPILRATLSTLFLLIVANWQLSILSGIGDGRLWNPIPRMLLRTAFAVMLSFFTLTLSIIDVYSVLSLYWLLNCKDLRTAAIIGTCPILIPVPPERQHDLDRLAGETGETVAENLREDLFPLALVVSRQGEDTSPKSEQNRLLEASAANVPDVKDTSSVVEEGKDASSVVKEGKDASPKSEQNTALQAWKQEVPVEASKKQPYIVLSPLFLGKHGKRAREALLKKKLVPEYQDLRILRSRSSFQNVITVVQVLWYMVGVAVRLAERRMNSPLEVIVSHLSVQVLLQLVMATVACSHYQRPLLLRLSPMQFKKFTRSLYANTSPTPTPTRWAKYAKYCIMGGVLVFTVFLLPMPLLYYAFRVRQPCLLCFCSTLLMALLPLFSFLILGTLVVCQLCHSRAQHVIKAWPPNSLGLPWLQEQVVHPLLFGLLFIALLYAFSIVLGGVATNLHWELFNLGTSDIWNDCILPHISST